MKKSISSIVLLTFLLILIQGCATHSTNKKVFKAPASTKAKVIYKSEQYVDRSNKY
jgi:hypothetical protein